MFFLFIFIVWVYETLYFSFLNICLSTKLCISYLSHVLLYLCNIFFVLYTMKQSEYIYTMRICMYIRYSFTKLPFIHRSIFTKLVLLNRFFYFFFLCVCMYAIRHMRYEKGGYWVWRWSHSISLERVHNLIIVSQSSHHLQTLFVQNILYVLPFNEIGWASINGFNSNTIRSMKTTLSFLFLLSVGKNENTRKFRILFILYSLHF